MTKSTFKKFSRGGVADPLRIQPRDIALLRDMWEFRFLNTEQILALHDGSRRNLKASLNLLFQHGYLDRPVVQKTARLATSHIVYSLGRKSAEVLASNAEEREGILRRVREVEKSLVPIIGHSLMISQFRVCLTLALRKKGSRITRWLQGQDLKEVLSYRGANPPLVPDAYFKIEDEGDTINFFLEADRATMTTERFVRKLKIYWSWREDKTLQEKLRLTHYRVLTITPSEGRSESLRAAGKDGDPRGSGSLMYLFAPETRYNIGTPDAVLQAVWKSPKDDTPHSILE